MKYRQFKEYESIMLVALIQIKFSTQPSRGSPQQNDAEIEKNTNTTSHRRTTNDHEKLKTKKNKKKTKETCDFNSRRKRKC